MAPFPACQEAEVFTLETNRGERETKIEMRVSKERMQVVALRQDCGKMPPAEQHDGIGGRRRAGIDRLMTSAARP